MAMTKDEYFKAISEGHENRYLSPVLRQLATELVEVRDRVGALGVLQGQLQTRQHGEHERLQVVEDRVGVVEQQVVNPLMTVHPLPASTVERIEEWVRKVEERVVKLEDSPRTLVQNLDLESVQRVHEQLKVLGDRAGVAQQRLDAMGRTLEDLQQGVEGLQMMHIERGNRMDNRFAEVQAQVNANDAQGTRLAVMVDRMQDRVTAMECRAAPQARVVSAAHEPWPQPVPNWVGCAIFRFANGVGVCETRQEPHPLQLEELYVFDDVETAGRFIAAVLYPRPPEPLG